MNHSSGIKNRLNHFTGKDYVYSQRVRQEEIHITSNFLLVGD